MIRNLRSPGVRLASWPAILLAILVPLVTAQSEATSAALHGVVRDLSGHPVANASVSLQQTKAGSQGITVRTDSKGVYNFPSLTEGTYNMTAESTGLGKARLGPFSLGAKEVKTIDLTLASDAASATLPAFYDEPQFTVAGVTQTGTAGGHGSDVVQRTSDALAKATVSLSNSGASLSRANAPDLERERDGIREQLTHEDKAELHHRLGDIDEKLGNALEAVREYQRAAEMEPSEAYLFDWGAELLAHRALQASAEVFAKGHRLFPGSSRMLVGLGVALYSQGAYDKALQSLFEASDLNAADSIPYVFLGKIQGVETVEPEGLVEKFRRFVSLQPENATANYYYAVSLWKQSQGDQKKDNFELVQGLLEKAVRIDPKLSAAYLQLGILFSQKGDLQRAIAEYQKALESDANLAEAHYRLGQAYRRSGEKEKAERELQLFDQLSKKSAEQAERERREIQQFVITLRDGPTVP